MDLVIQNRFEVNNFLQDPNAIYVLPRGEDRIIDGEFVEHQYIENNVVGSWKFLDDMFLVANSKNMDLYCMTYDYIDELVEIKKDETFGTFIDGVWTLLRGASIAGETAMIYNHNKNLRHLKARPTYITKAFTMTGKDVL